MDQNDMNVSLWLDERDVFSSLFPRIQPAELPGSNIQCVGDCDCCFHQQILPRANKFQIGTNCTWQDPPDRLNTGIPAPGFPSGWRSWIFLCSLDMRRRGRWLAGRTMMCLFFTWWVCECVLKHNVSAAGRHRGGFKCFGRCLSVYKETSSLLYCHNRARHRHKGL